MTSREPLDFWKASRDSDRSTVWRRVNGDELDDMLAAAERLRVSAVEQYDRARTRRLVTFVAVILNLTFAASLLVVGLANRTSRYGAGNTLLTGSNVLWASVLIVTISTTVVGTLLALTVNARSDALSARSGGSLEISAEIAGMVRESFLEVAARESWSYVRIEATKARLSAFPLRGGGGRGFGSSRSDLGDEVS